MHVYVCVCVDRWAPAVGRTFCCGQIDPRQVPRSKGLTSIIL